MSCCSGINVELDAFAAAAAAAAAAVVVVVVGGVVEGELPFVAVVVDAFAASWLA